MDLFYHFRVFLDIHLPSLSVFLPNTRVVCHRLCAIWTCPLIDDNHLPHATNLDATVGRLYWSSYCVYDFCKPSSLHHIDLSAWTQQPPISRQLFWAIGWLLKSSTISCFTLVVVMVEDSFKEYVVNEYREASMNNFASKWNVLEICWGNKISNLFPRHPSIV